MRTQQPTCGRMHSWQGGRVIWTTMTPQQLPQTQWRRWHCCRDGWRGCQNIRKWCRIQKSTRFCQHRWGGELIPPIRLPKYHPPNCHQYPVVDSFLTVGGHPFVGGGTFGGQRAMVGQQQQGRRRWQGCLRVALYNTKEVRAAKKTA